MATHNEIINTKAYTQLINELNKLLKSKYNNKTVEYIGTKFVKNVKTKIESILFNGCNAITNELNNTLENVYINDFTFDGNNIVDVEFNSYTRI